MNYNDLNSSQAGKGAENWEATVSFPVRLICGAQENIEEENSLEGM